MGQSAVDQLEDYFDRLENENYHTIDLIAFSRSFANRLGDEEHAFSDVPHLVNYNQVEDFIAYEAINV